VNEVIPYLHQAVQKLEERLLDMPQASIVTIHTFQPGVYERKIVIPPWTVLTGAAHKTAYKVRVERGRIAVNTDDGIKLCEGPCEFAASAGIKRAGRVFEDEVVWVDVYDNPDECRDLAMLEERLYVVPECGLGESRRLERDREDYRLFLTQIGMEQHELERIVQHEADMMQVSEWSPVEVRPSALHGMGLFALESLAAGTFICPGRVNGKRTVAGRYINHSLTPNVIPVKIGEDIYAVAIQNIQAHEELLVDYRDSMRVNFGIAFQGDLICQAG
jgi:hypothetical protein